MAATARTTGVKLVRLRANGRAASGAVDIQVLSRQAGLHPDVVRRLVRLGLLEPIGPARRGPGAELFPPDAAALLARATRLRRDLGLNYAGAVLASELLARIDELEARLRRYEPPDPGAR